MRYGASLFFICYFGCSHDASHEGHGAAGTGGGHEGHSVPPATPMIRPEPWMGSLAASRAVDKNPDPAIVEVDLTAAETEVEYLPGKRARVWAYNGTVPGPTIEASVGDQVIVHFKNQLPEPTTIHWHGLRVPNAMDGAPTQEATVAAGGTFEYRFTVPDDGLFWFHPHMRSDVQVEKGLYGTFLVRDPSGPTLPAMTEEVLVLDDVLLDPSSGALQDGTNPRIEHLGREGNLALVNGQRSNLGISVRAGELRRFRVVNAANGRYFKLALAGGALTRIGGDGGYLEAPAVVSELLLVPGERADLVLTVPVAGATATLRALAYRRDMMLEATEAVDLLRLIATADPAMTPAVLPASLRSIAPLSQSGAMHEIKLGDRIDANGKMEHTINGATFPMVPTLESPLGEVERWSIVNDTMTAHPFHLHGFFFQREGAREWKDTIDIPAMTTVPLLVDFAPRDGAIGSWLYHCHILEHAESGMMAQVTVR